MGQNIEQLIQAAIDKSEKWHTEGWKVTFGTRSTEVNSLEEAEKLPRNFVYRLEAIAYWTRVKGSGAEAADWGRRALASLKKGDMTDVNDSVYYAMVVEKPINDKAPTWAPVVQALTSKAA